MRLLALPGLALAGAVAFGVVAVPCAEASPPEFNVAAGQTFKATSTISELKTSTEVIKCTRDTMTGQVTGTDSVGNVQLKFNGCGAEKGGQPCEAKSVGAGAGEIALKTLKGNLGTVATSEAESGVGLLLEPSISLTFTTIANTGCIEETLLTGKVAGEVSPVRARRSTFLLFFGTPSEKQAIKKITVLGVAQSPTLTAFGLAATLRSTDNLAFSTALEVT